jgi:hypothetical protein
VTRQAARVIEFSEAWQLNLGARYERALLELRTSIDCCGCGGVGRGELGTEP